MDDNDPDGNETPGDDESEEQLEARDLEEADLQLLEEIEDDPGIKDDPVLAPHMAEKVHSVLDVPQRMIEAITNPERRKAVEDRQAQINEQVRLANEQHEREERGEPEPEPEYEPTPAEVVKTQDVPTFMEMYEDLRQTPGTLTDFTALNAERQKAGKAPLRAGTFAEKQSALFEFTKAAEQLANVVGDPNRNPAIRVDRWQAADERTREQATAFFGVTGVFDTDVNGEQYAADLKSFKDEALADQEFTARQLDLMERKWKR